MKAGSGKEESWTKTRPTREGIFFVILSLIIGFAALNTGNNLLYIVFGITLSLVAISGIVSMINISSLDISLDSYSDIFALTPGNLWISVYNKKTLIPSYSITLEIQKNYYYLDKINTGQTERIRVKTFFKDRGLNGLPEISIATRYPFGFFKKWVSMNFGSRNIVVFPRILSKKETEKFNKSSIGENISINNGRGSELKSLKNYSQGDNIKDIHWKISARANKLITREYFSENTKNIKMEFNPGTDNKIELEKYISRKASTYLDFIKKGYNVEFITPGRKFLTGKNDLKDKKVLTYLAMYGMVKNVAA